MNFTQAVKSGFRNYVKFSGRASRSEFWWWWLFQVLAPTIVGLLASNLANLLSIGLILPTLAASVRRVHDTGRTGWWVAWPWISFGVLIVSGIALFIDLGIELATSVDWDSSTNFDGASGMLLLVVGLSALSLIVAFVVNLILLVQKSDPNLNRFGPPAPPRV